MYARLIIVALGAWLVLIITTVDREPQREAGPIWGDFPAFFAAGQSVAAGDGSVELYDPALQRARQDRVIGSDSVFMPYAYPPQFAIAYVPFTHVPYRVSYLVNSALMFAALAVALALMRPMVSIIDRYPWTTLAAATVFVPTTYALGAGQNVTISIMLIAWVWRSLNDDRETTAGVAVALLMFKPQYAVPLLGLLLVGRHYRAVGAALAGTALIGVVNTLLVGTSWLPDWLGTADRFVSVDLDRWGLYRLAPLGFFRAVLGAESLMADVLGGAVIAGTAAVLIWLWHDHRAPLDLVMSATAAGLLLTSLHSAFYEAGLVTLTVAVIVNRDPSRTWLVPAMLAVGFSQYLSFDLGWSPLPPFVAALFVTAVVQARQAAREPPGRLRRGGTAPSPDSISYDPATTSAMLSPVTSSLPLTASTVDW